MERRRFIQILAGAPVAASALPGYGQSAKASAGLLLETAGFSNPGGWVLDTQFYHQTGGSFLLAHGMGTPVEDASTEINFPKAGTYHLHVRTRDWCPGDWEAPGRFQVCLDGTPLEHTFGTKPGWAWEKPSPIEIKKAGKVTVSLKDLTGFAGRCDALYFTTDPKEAPPSAPAELPAWKDQVTGRHQREIETKDFDVIIVGGGIAGCAAALAADSQGIKVALIQDRPLFGGNASSEIRVHVIGIPGKGAGILNKIDTEHWPNGSHKAHQDQVKREKTLAESGVTLFPNYLATGLEMKGKEITTIEARQANSGEITRFRAPVFVDCTGDGWLGFWAGADFRYGRESSDEFDEAWDKHGDLWSPKEADNRVMGTSVMWNTEVTKKPVDFPEVPWAMPVAKKSNATMGDWNWEYCDNDLHQIHDAEQIRDHMFRAIYGTFHNAKQHPKNRTLALKWVGFVGGRRESRRLMGPYIYTMKDALERRQYPDTVVEEKRELDTHYQLKLTGSPDDFRTKALFRKTHGLYFLPFRTLYSRSIPNLMMAGRCFSCSHIGLSGPRVQYTTGQMGIATGYAAALCKKHQALPAEITAKHIDELRALIGYENNSA